jgi:CheY-like chemotaxis protein
MRKTFVAFLIDDDAIDRQVFAKAAAGFDTPVYCEFANDGSEALKILSLNASFIPDFIFIDIYVPPPGINGLEFLRRLKKIRRFSKVPGLHVFRSHQR